MRKIKNVLRLKFQLHLSDRQIARSCALARSTVAEYVRRAQRAGLTWPLPEGWDDRTIAHRLFPPTGKSPPAPRPLPDFALISIRPRNPSSYRDQGERWKGCQIGMD